MKIYVLVLLVISSMFITPEYGHTASPVEATLTLMNRDVVTFRADLIGATPEQRVQRAKKRIIRIEDADLSQPIRVEPLVLGAVKGYQFMIGTQPIFALIEDDIDSGSGETLEAIVKQTTGLLDEVRKAHQEQRYWPSILKGIGLSSAATALLCVLLWSIWYISRIFNRLLNVIRTQHEQATRQIEWQEYAASMGLRTLWLVKWVLAAFLSYTWISFVLGQFPYTSPFGARLGDFLVRLFKWIGSGIVAGVPGIITILVVFFVTRAFVEVLKLFFDKVQAGRLEVPFLHAETVSATRQIVTLLAWGLGVAVAYPFIPGSSSDIFKGLSVMFGLMISLGSTGLMTQMMSGLVVIYSRALRKGDMVSVNGTDGIVVEIGALATKIVNLKHEEITIPNSVLIGNSIRNYTRLAESHGSVISTKITIGYDAPWRQVHALLTTAAHLTDGVCKEPEPFVLQRALSDFYVEYELFAQIAEPLRRFFILNDLHANIQDQFNEYGVQIMSPNFEAQPDKTVVVPKAQWFAAPAKKPEDS